MLTERSKEKELLDLGSAYYSQNEYAHCQKMLFKINQLLGFFGNTYRLLKTFPANTSVLDIGCGGGLFILHLSQYLPTFQFIGTDISADAITLAQQNYQEKNSHNNLSFQLQHSNTLTQNENSMDVILSTLVCHHLTDDELIHFLQTTLKIARKAVIINDLHRHGLATFFYRLISPVFRNRLITHDGLISIRRGFTRKEWLLLLQKADIKHYQLKWFFPFRWRLVLWKK